MDKKKLIALSDFMREQLVTVSDLIEMANYVKFYGGNIPLLEEGEEMPVALRYADNEVAKKFIPLRRIKAIHLENVDIGLNEFSIPMSYLDALQNCRQQQKRLMTETQASIIYQNFKKINEVLKEFGFDSLREGRYWLETPASKSYLAKAIDFSSGKVLELKRSESCRVRPVFLT